MVFKQILCVSELSPISKNAEMAALTFASVFQSQLTVLSCGESYAHIPNNYFDENIIQPVPDPLRDVNYTKHFEQKKQETIDYFLKLQQEMNLNINDNIHYEIKLENEVTATLDLLEERNNGFDLIVVEKQNNSHWEKLLFGSPGKEICDESKIPTLLVPGGDQWKMWRPVGIVASTSLSETAQHAEKIGASIATEFGAQLTLLHVLSEEEQQFANNFTHIVPLDYIPMERSLNTFEETKILAQEKIDKMIFNLKASSNGKEIHSHIGAGDISLAVTSFLKANPKNNLLIIGSRGENALKRFFLGSNTDVLEEDCEIPILIVFYPTSKH